MIGGDGAGTLVALGTVIIEEQVSAGAESSVVAVAATTAALTRLGVNIPAWNRPRLVWREQTPERRQVFALEDQDELGFWGHLMGLCEVAERSLQSAMNAVGNDMAEAIRVRASS